MHVICLTPLEEGVYNDHNSDNIVAPEEGWALIPEGFPLPTTFPRLGSIEAEEIDGVMTITSLTEGAMPEPIDEPDPEPDSDPVASVWEELDAAYQEGVNDV